MRKQLWLLSFLMLFGAQSVWGLHVPAGNDPLPGWRNIPLRELADMRYRDFLLKTGQHFNAKAWVGYHFLRHKMRSEIRKNPAITAGEFMATATGNKWVLIVVIVLALLLILFLVGIRSALPG